MNATTLYQAHARALGVLGLALATCLGCGGNRFPVADVEGTVLLDGKPVPEAKVVFMPSSFNDKGESGPYSQGMTDSEGRFKLHTLEEGSRLGAVIGTHTVIVSTKKARLDPNELDRVIIEQPESIPPQYTHYKKSPLRFEVPSDGADNAEFLLQSAGQ